MGNLPGKPQEQWQFAAFDTARFITLQNAACTGYLAITWGDRKINYLSGKREKVIWMQTGLWEADPGRLYTLMCWVEMGTLFSTNARCMDQSALGAPSVAAFKPSETLAYRLIMTL